MLAAVATLTFALLATCLGAMWLAGLQERRCRRDGCRICPDWGRE